MLQMPALTHVQEDPSLNDRKKRMIVAAASQLKACEMAVYDERSGALYVSELGRVASHFYIK
jgi:activating signal cointegrator complex subunit 3